MKLNPKILLLAVCFTIPFFLNAQSWIWAEQATGPGEDDSWDLVIDQNYDLIVAGHYQNTFDLGNGPLASSGVGDVFVAKYDSSGALLWTAEGNGPGDDRSYGVDVDFQGNVYVAGTFTDSLTFGTTLLTSPGNSAWFLVKYDDQGALQWARQGPANQANTGRDVVAAFNGRVYLTGGFSSQMNFAGTTYSATGSQDLFLVQYDGSGNEQWALTGNGSGADEGLELTQDPLGNIVIAGTMEDDIDFLGTAYTNPGDGLFMAMVDPIANLVWSDVYDGTVEDRLGLGADACEAIYLTGTFTGTLSESATNSWAADNRDGFLLKISHTNPTGGLVWARQITGADDQTARELYTDPSGRCYLTGSFSGITEFDPLVLDTVQNREEAYILKFDETGAYEFHLKPTTGVAGATIGNGIALDPYKNIYFTGTFRDSLGIGGTSLYGDPDGNTDVFLGKIFHHDCDIPPGNYVFEETLCDGDTLWIGYLASQAHCTWSTGDTTHAIAVTSPGTYILEVRVCGILYTTTYNVTSGGNASVNLGADTTICAPATVLLDAGSGGLRYLWNTGDTTSTITVDEAGYYEVTCWSACDSATDGINVFVKPMPDPQLAGTMLICGSRTTMLQANADPEYSYIWSSGDVTSSITVQGPGMFWVDVTNECGTVRDSLNVNYEEEDGTFFPNVFSPNGDGNNDYFGVEFENEQEFEISVYDRWGVRLFATNDPRELWDGNNNGKAMPEGVYFWIVKGLDCQNEAVTEKGWVALLR